MPWPPHARGDFRGLADRTPEAIAQASSNNPLGRRASGPDGLAGDAVTRIPAASPVDPNSTYHETVAHDRHTTPAREYLEVHDLTDLAEAVHRHGLPHVQAGSLEVERRQRFRLRQVGRHRRGPIHSVDLHQL